MTAQVLQSKPATNPFSDFFQFGNNVKVIAGLFWCPTKPVDRAFSDVIRAWGMLILLLLRIILTVKRNENNIY